MAQLTRTGHTDSHAYLKILTNEENPKLLEMVWDLPDMEDHAVRYKGASNEVRLIAMPDDVTLPYVTINSFQNPETNLWTYSAQPDDITEAATQLAEVKLERDRRLKQCDFIVTRHRDQTDTSGVTPDLTEAEYQEWLNYRQMLRDLPSIVDLENPVFPEEPV